MTVYSVTDFVHGINELLTRIPTCVQGEVSGFKIVQNRFVWFDLKDAKSCVSCFMLAFQLQQPLEDGMMIQATGTPGLFTKSGRFHLRVQSIQLVGEGSLKRQYEMLKAKLAAEGLFDQARKRALPRFPQHIGLVTSPDAAAFTDVLRILQDRWAGLDIKHFPVVVQGTQAVSSLVQTLTDINQYWVNKLDLVIITRGGGSLEDLQAFNNEAVVRAVFALPIPSLVGIGHERDETLIEFVADQRAATPSNAAELAVPHKADVVYQIVSLAKQQAVAFEQQIQLLTHQIQAAVETLNVQMNRYSTITTALCSRFHMATQAWQEQINIYQEKINRLKQLLNSYHPNNILKRGYSITQTTSGKIISSIKQLAVGSTIHTVLADGKIKSKVL